MPADLCQPRIENADWLEFAASLLPLSVDLLYADPPFNPGRAQASPPNASRKGRTLRSKYQDSWPTAAEYISWLRERLVATLPALKPTAVILLHVDWRTSHHV